MRLRLVHQLHRRVGAPEVCEAASRALWLLADRLNLREGDAASDARVLSTLHVGVDLVQLRGNALALSVLHISHLDDLDLLLAPRCPVAGSASL